MPQSDIEYELSLATDAIGNPLASETKEKLRAVVANPTEETWDKAHGLVLSGSPRPYTLWQAVCAVDPDFPRTGPRVNFIGRRVSGWSRIPDRETLVAAIKWATH